MTQPAEVFDSYDAIGNRQDLVDMIWNISPTETPFMSNAGRTPVSATQHDWQTDSLDAPDATNAHIEGDNETTEQTDPTTRPINSTQISKKVYRVSGTQRVTDAAGRSSDELLYQRLKKGRSLRRDMESVITQNAARVPGDSSTARTLRALETWYETNTNRGVGGADGSDLVPPTDGTQRPYDEDLLKDVILQVYNSGGDPSQIMSGPFNKQVGSTFSGVTALQTNAPPSGDRAIVGGMEMYVSDFGELRMTPNRFQRERTVHILDMEFWAIGFLREFETEELARTGDSTNEVIRAEYTLEARNEAASGVVADLDTA